MSGRCIVCPAGSRTEPDQSPQFLKLSTAVGRKETTAATPSTSVLTTQRRQSRGTSRKITTAHGSSSGMFVAFAPVSNAAASTENQRSETCRDCHARNPNATAASAKAVGKVSLPALPAWSRKL